MNRRRFLRTAALTAAGAALAGCDIKRMLDRIADGKERLWGMNIHPLGGEVADAQIEAARAMGIRRVRITLGLHEDLAGYYLRSLRAQFVGLVDDFRGSPPPASQWPALVRATVQRAPGLDCYEILNEPISLAPEVYVQDYLRPAYEIVKRISPGSRVAAAAPTGTSAGLTYFYELTRAGADDWCDLRAAHVYGDKPEYYMLNTSRRLLVTETGVADPALHVDWWSRTMVNTDTVLDPEEQFFYVLADTEDSGFAIISRHSRPGAVAALSPLYDYVRAKYG